MDTVLGAARHAVGVTPKVALCAHSQFGDLDTSTGKRMRAALELLDARGTDFAYEGEMHIDAALDPTLRDASFRTRASTGRQTSWSSDRACATSSR